MNNAILLILIFLLIFPKTIWGDGNSYVNNISDYINSPKSSDQNPVNKNTNPIPAMVDKTKKNSDKDDSQLESQPIPYLWKTCSTDNDCTAVVGDCVTWDSINKKHLRDLSGNLNACSSSIDPGFQPVSVCVHKACQTTDKTTNVSWEEWLDGMQGTAARQK